MEADRTRADYDALGANGGHLDSAGNLLVEVREFDTLRPGRSGVARVERGTCAYTSATVSSEYRAGSGTYGCGQSIVSYRTAAVTETMVWGRRFRNVTCDTSRYFGSWERVQQLSSGGVAFYP